MFYEISYEIQIMPGDMPIFLVVSVLFEMLELLNYTINLETKHIGIKNIDFIAMFSEDLGNCSFLNSSSSTVNVILSLLFQGFY